jgi:hypothetical protein
MTMAVVCPEVSCRTKASKWVDFGGNRLGRWCSAWRDAGLPLVVTGGFTGRCCTNNIKVIRS